MLTLHMALPSSLARPRPGDSTIRLWSLDTLRPICVVQPAISGRIHSLLWCPLLSLLYFGSQSTFIQWLHLPEHPPSPSLPSFPPLRTPEPRQSRFFDAQPPSGASTPAAVPTAGGSASPSPKIPTLYGETDNSVPAHWGYVYALAWVEDPKRPGRMWLASGSGGGDVKVGLGPPPFAVVFRPTRVLTRAPSLAPLARSGTAGQTARSTS